MVLRRRAQHLLTYLLLNAFPIGSDYVMKKVGSETGVDRVI